MLPRKIKAMQTKSINFLTVFRKKQASPLRSYTNSTVFKSNSVVIEAPVKKKKKSFGFSGGELSGGVHSIPTGVHLTHHMQERALCLSVQE